MKKTYIVPTAEEILLNYQLNLLTGSLIDVNDEANIVDDGGGDIIDTGGVLDPDSHAFDLDFEDISNFE